jgi:hypothetical protein
MTRSPNSQIGIPTAVNIGAARFRSTTHLSRGTKCFVDRLSPSLPLRYSCGGLLSRQPEWRPPCTDVRLESASPVQSRC